MNYRNSAAGSGRLRVQRLVEIYNEQYVSDKIAAGQIRDQAEMDWEVN